ncbi:MAG: glutathione peroxidase [Thiobacillaceae bacterium]|jgi:glutathione peroxidase|nr:glutathione peroxidase [Thiobacillaceae bacterium]
MNPTILSKQSHRPRALPAPRPFPARVLLALLAVTALMLTFQAQASDCPELLRHKFNSLQTGAPQDLCQYRGQVVLVVNTASYCAYTDQYGGLEELYARYRDRGLVVLGFPSNDFGGQEPGGNQQIAKFCRLTYGVEFPMFEKSHVVGDRRNGLYADLHRRTGQQPRWNFHKYLIDPSGQRVWSFESGVAPDDQRLVDEIRRLLDVRKAAKRTT